jgi:sugar phosphate permease
VRKRGRALGISIMGVGLGALLFPTAISMLIEAVGWRGAWVWFGVGIGSIAFVLALLLRTTPEEAGLLPDGAATQDARQTGAAPTEERSLTRREAVRTPAFWLLLAAFSLVGLGITGFQSNWHPFLVETGFGPAEASFGIAIYGLVSGLVRPGWGLLGERFPARYLLGGVSVATAVLIMVFLNVRGMAALVPVMFMAGLIMGGYLILRALLTANYFGRMHLGAVNGLFRPIVMGTGAAGPILFGALYDLQGGYTLAFIAAALAWGASGLIVLLAKPPRVR